MVTPEYILPPLFEVNEMGVILLKLADQSLYLKEKKDGGTYSPPVYTVCYDGLTTFHGLLCVGYDPSSGQYLLSLLLLCHLPLLTQSLQSHFF